MKTTTVVILLAALLAVSCQMPISGPAKTSGAGLKLSFLIAGTGPAASSSRSVAQAHLLLPTVTTLSVSLTSVNSGGVLTQTVSIPTGSNLVTANFGQVNVGNYAVKAQAFDAAGNLQFQQTGTLNLTSSSSSITLNLVPASTSGLNQLASGQIVTATLSPGTAMSWSVPSSELLSGGWSLLTTADPTVLLFAQDSNGAMFPSSDTKGALTTVQVTNAAASFVTLYNSGTSAQSVSLILNSPGTSLTIADLVGTWLAAPTISTQTTAGVTTTETNSTAYTFNADSSFFILSTYINNSNPLPYSYTGYWGTYSVSGNSMTITVTSELYSNISTPNPITSSSIGATVLPSPMIQTFPAFLYNGLFYSGYSGNGGALLTASGPTSGILGTWIENISMVSSGVSATAQVSITFNPDGTYSTVATLPGTASQTATGTYTISNGQVTTTSTSEGTTNSGTVYYTIIGYYLSIGGDSNAGGYVKTTTPVSVTGLTINPGTPPGTSTVVSGVWTPTGVGQTLQLSVTAAPSNATNQAVTWTVDGASGYTTVSSTGLVTVGGYETGTNGESGGVVTVKATANDGSGTTATFVVNLAPLG